MKKTLSDTSCYDSRSIKNNIRLLCWILMWAGTMLLVDKAELYQWHSSELLTILGIIVNALIGLGMIVIYIRYLKVIDDLQRKIQLDALAFSVGIALVGGFTYSLLEAADFIRNAEASDVILLLCVSYSVAVIVGELRYR